MENETENDVQDKFSTLRGIRAMVVEDEGIIQLHLRKILGDAGMTLVGAAQTGEAGVEKALKLRPDVILMDIKMPGRINGMEAARKILEHYPSCIVMLTAYSEHREKCFELGASGFLVKPIESRNVILELTSAYEKFREEQTKH